MTSTHDPCGSLRQVVQRRLCSTVFEDVEGSTEQLTKFALRDLRVMWFDLRRRSPGAPGWPVRHVGPRDVTWCDQWPGRDFAIFHGFHGPFCGKMRRASQTQKNQWVYGILNDTDAFFQATYQVRIVWKKSPGHKSIGFTAAELARVRAITMVPVWGSFCGCTGLCFC